MHSDNVDGANVEPLADKGVISRLLDPAFGFFVWLGHLVFIYVAAALSCGLGLVAIDASPLSGFVVTLAAFTVASATVVVLHGVKRYRQSKDMSDHGFANRIAVGQDALAALAILWQLFPIFMVPVCR